MNASTNIDAGARRRVFTVDEVLAMQRTGVFEDDEKFELLEGELVLMQSKLNPHELYKNNLVRAFYRLLPDHVAPWVQATLYLRPNNAPDPDIMLFPRGRSIETLAPEEVYLLVEVADTTLATDLGVKATLYARFKVAEYWVIDVSARRLVVHRDPDGDVWREIRVFGADDTVAPLAFPEAAVRLADLEY
ncbi:MAG TPA: Uma2 family endonuclease [Caulobacteraceae bacterium]|nr:Uma2 family endonuclease [Caulobacteraceae bacterium]